MRRVSAPTPRSWEIFCRVVDNFGDIGVCWRLARILAAEHGLRVRLWVDAWDAFSRLAPEAGQSPGEARLGGVEIRQWPAAFPQVEPAEVVIEAFACEVPESHLEAMAARRPAPVWINLEYLTAEDWIAECHRLRSPHPRLPLVKHFFFPGFTDDTGGLLREEGLLEVRDAFLAEGSGRAALLARLGIEPPPPDTLVVSLFAYTLPQLEAMLRLWSEAPRPMLLLVPEGRVVAELGRALGRPLAAGGQVRRGALTVAVVPFSAQDGYDRLLWACDLNFVRGEDSFVRAQWAGHPFVWQIYAQAEDAHGVKLEAFLDRHCVGLGESAATALRAFWQAWNGNGDAAAAWPAFAAALPEIAAHARDWSRRQAAMPDLATKLVLFCAQQVKS